jgi:hypothetical protein
MALKAMAHLDLALRMSPHDPQNVRIYMALAAAHYAAGRFTEAVAYGRQSGVAASGFFRRSPNLRGQPSARWTDPRLHPNFLDDRSRAASVRREQNYPRALHVNGS